MRKILQYDSYLIPYKKDILYRLKKLKERESEIKSLNLSLPKFSSFYKYFGIHKVKGMYIYREYAPNAKELYLIGDFNNWNRTSHKLTNLGNGVFEIAIKENIENSRVKVRVVSTNFDEDRIPLYINYVTRESDYSMTGRVYTTPYKFKYPKPTFTNNLFIYECHIGMSGEIEGYSSYKDFTKFVLPKIIESGFNTIQIMGIMEHPYYASFGYQVSNFFAPCSLFGTPNDLKELIDQAHKNNIKVLLDVVHSHAVKNINEGINRFDGDDNFFFKGDHPLWGTKVFDYSRLDVLQFLLSNLSYYLKEFNFDGFRFDGVTSMLYNNFGHNQSFTSYDDYFSLNTNVDAIIYLQLANKLIKSLDKNAITIAEDVSGMPGMCLPIVDGGIGFDYRLALGEPDLWVRLVKDVKDEDWAMSNIYYELTQRRPQEKVIGYAECHDQALVGDKTIIFRLCDKEMYFHMLKEDENLIVSRGISLYKTIYGLTMSLGGEGYLNFMGNEFGHPEWIDFPREGNGYSFKYAKRQWSLSENEKLKYQYMLHFNCHLISLLKEHNTLSNTPTPIYISDKEKIIAYIKGNLLFVISFNPTSSFNNLFLQLNNTINAKLLFTSDAKEYGGQNRIKVGEEHLSINSNGNDGVMIYLPNRTFNIYQLY